MELSMRQEKTAILQMLAEGAALNAVVWPVGRKRQTEQDVKVYLSICAETTESTPENNAMVEKIVRIVLVPLGWYLSQILLLLDVDVC